MLKQWLQSVFGPSSKFVAGDSVQPVKGERELMVVAKVVLNNGFPEPQLVCRWVDSVSNESREHLFWESELTPFDWNRPMERPLSSGLPPASPNPSLDAIRTEWQETNQQGLISAGIDVQGGLLRLNGNSGVYEKLLRRFSDGHQDFVSEFKVKAVNGEWIDAQRMAHTLKGLAGTLGMTNLQQISQDLESSVMQHNVDDLREKVSQLSDELEKILNSIRENVRHEPLPRAQSPSSLPRTLRELEQSLLEHSPQALGQVSQLGSIKGHEHEIEALGQAIASYQFEKALTVLRTITNEYGGPGDEAGR